ncbi:protein of unknown function [Candidatus Filomicrobium marinum]|uniref:Uncharacterized protein n=1 Tax=Candidatus Filomicrobium marinum TaxID=1608628 RepID=A0A0D6JHT7_9HYPH|nr:protein of unknown function [Candidatus Filomicrobium marinum]
MSFTLSTAPSKAAKLSGVDLSSTTPTITSAPKPTIAGASCARTAVMNPSSNRRCVRLWQVAALTFTRTASSAFVSLPSACTARKGVFRTENCDRSGRPIEGRLFRTSHLSRIEQIELTETRFALNAEQVLPIQYFGGCRMKLGRSSDLP